MLTRRLIDYTALGAAVLVLSGGFLRFFSTGGDLKHGDLLIESILVCFYASVSTIGLLHFGETVRTGFPASALFGLLALAAMSAIWAALPTVVLRRTAGVAGASFFGLILASHLLFSEQPLLLGRILSITAIRSLASCALKIGTGVDFGTIGESSNPMAEVLEPDSESEPGIPISRSPEYV